MITFMGEIPAGLFTVVGAVIGGSITALLAWRRTRASIRTAARVVYGELTENAAVVLYYRRFDRWPEAELRQAAWDAQGPVLARKRDGETYRTIHKGYAAFEGIAFLARESTVDDTVVPQQARETILAEAGADAANAVRRAANLAGVSREERDELTQRLAELSAKSTR